MSSTSKLSKDFKSFKITGKRVVGTSTNRPIIFLTISCTVGALPTGSHVKVRVTTKEGTVETRPYTPTKFSLESCELLVRVYEYGAVSSILGALNVGDSIEMMGPTGIHRYIATSSTFQRGPKTWGGINKIAMLAGGTGITPMLQIINAALRTPKQKRARDNLRISLLVFGSNVGDVMLEEELREIEERFEGALKVTYVISTPPPASQSGQYKTGSMRTLSHVDLFELLEFTPEMTDLMVCLCGPDGFTKKARKEMMASGATNVLTW